MLDDSSAVPVSAAAALGRLHRFTEASYTLLYRLAESAESDSELCRPPALTALPGPLCVAVTRDYAVYHRRERQGRSVGALPLVQNGRSPPSTRCSGDSGHPGPGFAC